MAKKKAVKKKTVKKSKEVEVTSSINLGKIAKIIAAIAPKIIAQTIVEYNKVKAKEKEDDDGSKKRKK